MTNMFQNAKSFNQDISRWVVGQVEFMNWMFNGAKAFSFRSKIEKEWKGILDEMDSAYKSAMF